MPIRVVNRWCGPRVVDFGPPLGAVRVPSGGTVLDLDFNELKLPRKTLALVSRRTIELVDLEAEPEEKAKAEAEAKAKARSKAEAETKKT